MSPAGRRRRYPFALLLLVLAVCEMTDDEFHCEEAVAHLADCCPGFEPRGFDCTAGPGCSSPALLADQARCIQGKSCEMLVAGGTCDRALHAAGSGPTVADPLPVCR